ncbi:hypothetical protein ABTM31_21235, partial [Acinetobacter baumannii]
HLSGPLADFLSGWVGLVLLLVAFGLVLVGGWAWETEAPWFTRKVSRLWRFALAPAAVGLAAIATIVRLFALS